MLSIVIIGRNEAENIPRLADSIVALREHCGFPIETVFVDSASIDNSVELATERFNKVCEVLEDSRMNASAGRYVGTNHSSYEWIFFIDADMEIHQNFFPVVAALPEAPQEWQGVIGDYVHNFDDGSIAVQTFEGDVFKSEWAASFGGAVILRREAVLQAGNWNPGVFGKEEMNLYSRLGNGKRVVWYSPGPMINHYSESYTQLELLKRLLYPSGGQGKVFYGYGQSVRALLQAGKWNALIRLEPEPYLVWVLVIAGMLCIAVLPGFFGLAILGAVMILLALWMRPGPLIRFLTLPLQILTGWSRYTADFRPELKGDGSGS